MNHHRKDKFNLAVSPPKTDYLYISPSLQLSHQSTSSSLSSCPTPTSVTTADTGSNSILATSSSPSDKFQLPTAPNKDNNGPGKELNGSKGLVNGGSRNEFLCTDRKGFFDHLKPKSLILSSCRVTMIQAAQLLSTYLTDQLEYESKLDEKLNNDQITHLEYESSLLEFEETEWKKRWNDLLYSNKIYLAIGKFHLLTFIIRSYEGLLWNVVKVDGNFMDKVTKDTFRVAVNKSNELSDYQYSQRSTRRTIHHKSTSSSNTNTGHKNEVTSTYELGKQMFTSCFCYCCCRVLLDVACC